MLELKLIHVSKRGYRREGELKIKITCLIRLIVTLVLMRLNHSGNKILMYHNITETDTSQRDFVLTIIWHIGQMRYFKILITQPSISV